MAQYVYCMGIKERFTKSQLAVRKDMMCKKNSGVKRGGKVGDIFKLKMEVTGFMETDCIIALIAGILVLVSGSVIGFYSWDKAYGGRNVITGIGVMVLGAVLIAGSFSANNSAKERKARESEVVEKYKEGTDLYINGVKKDNIDLNGVNLDNYDITVEKDKIYLKEK